MILNDLDIYIFKSFKKEEKFQELYIYIYIEVIYFKEFTYILYIFIVF